VLDRVAAVVGGEAIPLSELESRWREIQAHPQEGGPKTREELLNRLIDSRVQLQRARDLGIEAGPADVDAALQRLMADNGIPSLAALKEVLAEEGRTVEDLRREVGGQLTRLRLIQREVTAKLRIPEDVLRGYYEAHRADFSKGRQVRLRQIVFQVGDLPPERQEDVVTAVRTLRDQLTDRASFRAAERRLAGSPGVVTGEAGLFGEQDLRPELAAAVLPLKAGEISQPLPLPTGMGVFLVDDVVPGVPIPFDDALARVRDRVAAEMTEARLGAWLADLKRNTHIQIRQIGPASAG
jgi:peptidyl-prolyl cis-trans isomerase SurA